MGYLDKDRQLMPQEQRLLTGIMTTHVSSIDQKFRREKFQSEKDVLKKSMGILGKNNTGSKVIRLAKMALK